MKKNISIAVGCIALVLIAIFLLLRDPFDDIKVGMSSNEVLQSLGEPDAKGEFVRKDVIMFDPPFINELPLGTKYKTWSYKISDGTVWIIWVDNLVADISKSPHK